MADVYEDFPPESNNLLNYMDSGNASADDDESDYETRLYSLVHYLEGDALKAGDVISNSDAFSYVSKGTKVSRLNPVGNIIETVDSSSLFGDKRSGPTLNQNNKFQSSENELRSLLHDYKNSSDFSHSTPLKKYCNQNTLLVNAFKQKSYASKFWTESSKKNYAEIEDQSVSECINVTPLNDSAYSDKISTDCSFTRKTNDFGSKSRKFNCKNNSECSAVSSRKHLKHDGEVDGNYLGNGRVLSKSKAQLRRRKNNESRISVIEVNEDLASSKYKMELNKGKTSTPSLRDTNHVTSKNAVQRLKNSGKNDLSESVIVVDDSDSNSSILEMKAPVKESPLVVILTSEDEQDKADGKMNMEEEEDIVVLYSGGEKPNTLSSSGKGLLSEDTPVQKKSKKKKKKKKKTNEKKKEQKLSSFSTQERNPSSWTEKMSHFYNDSWGGEDFDAKKLQVSMSGKRSKWPVMVSDLGGLKRMNGQRNIKCQRCNHYGHRARSCTEPQKPIVCLYCGIVGHVQTRCPTAICLCCGRPSMLYSYGCHVCSSSRNNNVPCTVCRVTGHLATDCPEIWRRYHSTTTEEDLANQARTMYKPCNQQYCSNCATRGHQYHECDKSKQQGNSQKRANSSFTEQNKHTKRRKLDIQNSQKRLCQRNGIRANVPHIVSYYYDRYKW